MFASGIRATPIVLDNNVTYGDKHRPCFNKLISERAGEKRQATQPTLRHGTSIKTTSDSLASNTPCMLSYMVLGRSKSWLSIQPTRRRRLEAYTRCLSSGLCPVKFFLLIFYLYLVTVTHHNHDTFFFPEFYEFFFFFFKQIADQRSV